MKVKDLIEKLQTEDPEEEILVYTTRQTLPNAYYEFDLAGDQNVVAIVPEHVRRFES